LYVAPERLVTEHTKSLLRDIRLRTLQEMLAYRPQTAAEMLSISGVGQTKLDRYGDRFLSVLRDEAGA
jgi:ATP-dependent DNA helicase RecQ